jgi:hypothetical protein
MGRQEIHVVLRNGKPDSIPAFLLGSLIASGEVLQFQRSNGWVTVGKDSVRGVLAHYTYFGPERRKSQQKKQCAGCPDMVDGACIQQACLLRYIQVKC